MKSKSFHFIAAALTAAVVLPAFALEAPVDNAPPPPADRKPLPEIKLPAADQPAASDKIQADAPFLGVVSGDIPEMLGVHLHIKSGEGAVVRALFPDGPAAKAGVERHDVITKVGGQPVAGPAEISTRIASHKPGEKIAIDLIHQGKPITLDVTLGVKPAEVANAQPRALDQLDLDAFPKELADRLRDAIAGNVGEMDIQDDKTPPGAPQMDQALRALRKQVPGAIADAMLGQPGDPAAGKAQVHAGATVRMMDQQGSVEVKSNDGAKEVTLRDKQGNVTWNGPWDTAQDKAAAPADVRSRVDALNLDNSFQGSGLRLQMRPAVPDVLPGNDP